MIVDTCQRWTLGREHTPTHAPAVGINYETGEMHGDRSRTDFAGSQSRRARRGAAELPLLDGSIVAALGDPPCSAHYARELYGVE